MEASKQRLFSSRQCTQLDILPGCHLMIESLLFLFANHTSSLRNYCLKQICMPPFTITSSQQRLEMKSPKFLVVAICIRQETMSRRQSYL